MHKWMMVALLVVTAPAFAKIGVEWSAEAGWVPQGAFGDIQTQGGWGAAWDVGNCFYTQLDAIVFPWPWLFFGCNITVQMRYIDVGAFQPRFTNYGFRAGVRLGIVEVFCSHDCSHPNMDNPFAGRVVSVWGEGSVTRVAMRIIGRT
jgi:hypothetical protein